MLASGQPGLVVSYKKYVCLSKIFWKLKSWYVCVCVCVLLEKEREGFSAQEIKNLILYFIRQNIFCCSLIWRDIVLHKENCHAVLIFFNAIILREIAQTTRRV